MKCWDWEKNGDLDPYKLTKGSGKKIWLNCDVCGHSFEAAVYHIVGTGTWCSFCTSKILCNEEDCQDCFDKSFASHDKAEFWSVRNTKTARQTFKGSHSFVFFDCVCGHTFRTVLYCVSGQETWCPYCSLPPKLLCNEDCKLCFKKSFASHDKAEFWSKENTKNPRQVFLFSNSSFLFNCVCGHTFKIQLSDISQGKWCSFCAGMKLCSDEKCQICFDKSFASHVKVKFWSTTNVKKPRQVFKSTAKMFFFDCKCGHRFRIRLYSIVSGSFCPYCSGKRLCDDTNCEQCFNKSFASHEKVSSLSPKNDLDPRKFTKYNRKKFLFVCEIGHEFSCALFNIVAGKWCPLCLRKGEEKLYKFLISSGFEITREKKFEWCKDKKPLPFDFLIKSLRVLIELDGHQHFRQVRNWGPPGEVQKRDLYKMRKANEYCYSVVRITWDMVYNDRGDWKEKLLKAIEEVEWHCCAFVCMNGEYDVYQGKV